MTKKETIKFLWNEIRKTHRKLILINHKNYWYPFYRNVLKQNVYALKIVKGIK
tara:strand:+ start:521 stop:679 length:159 start_codon:yes stop_codon:yes gene_type:complete